MAIDNTELDVIIPELWSEDLLSGTYQAAQVANRVQRVDSDVSAFGDTLHLPAMPQISVNDVTAATGAISVQDLTLTENQLLVNKWKECSFTFTNKATKQAKLDAIAAFKKDSPGAMIDQCETDLLGLYSDVTTNVVGSSTDVINEDLLLAAMVKLLNSKFGAAMRQSDRVSFVFYTGAFAQVKKVDVWNSAQITGYNEGGQMNMTVDALYGVPVFFNANVVSASSERKNLLFLREAFALGVQKNIGFQEIPNTGLARTFAADWLYGVKTRAESRAVLIKTA